MNTFTNWKTLNWSEYGAELLGTAFNLLIGFSIITFNFGKGLPMEHLIPAESPRLLINGLIFAGSGALFTISPLGKLSGAHLNPCVSLAFWLQGKMHKRDLIGYIIGQLLGAILGTFVVTNLWGKYALSVNNCMTLPSKSYALWYVFLAEVFMTCLLILSISIFLSHRRLLRWTPLMVWLLVATMVWLGAPISGTSLNTARSIGPAFISWFWQDQWLYCIAPPLGALIGVGVFRLISMGEREVLTGKLFHVHHYPCIFKNVKVPHLKKQY
ncbi:aquaporin family protein [Nostoc sp. CENA67]|uniref:Aquaporin family protein n=1 Tax=Amazonocrinis nigriterrae CENA67 TaxID=2794033 RepID=A0A8J7HNF4_9NOST|nr:MIP/aquaporin family protein [Amazonocrinis nigriterrae]MBH8562557.1 aquaporin family protein [Amazonocrinis nigriterrae CENA67]